MASKYVPSIADNNLLPESVIQDPRLIPDRGIWHPVAKEIFVDVDSYKDWYRREMAPANGIDFDTAPTVGILLQKSHINTKDDGHYVSLIQELEAQGAMVVPTYSGALDFSILIDEYFYSSDGKQAVDAVINLTGFALVGGPAKQDHPAAVECLRKLDRPYLCALPLVFQTFEEWKESELGLHPVQVALQVALPEIDGAMEPIIFAGRDGLTGRSVPLADRISALAERALKWANLRRKKNAEKNVAITIFSFPPDKGNVGTAAYLDVFGSIFSVLKGLQKDGYDVGEIPESIEALIDSVLHDKEARIASPELNVEYRMTVDEYRKLTPWAGDLEENWGPPPGQLNSDGQNLLIYGKKYGKIFIGVQPSFGYEGDPMRLLFSKSASPHHGFAAYYTYVEKVRARAGRAPFFARARMLAGAARSVACRSTPAVASRHPPRLQPRHAHHVSCRCARLALHPRCPPHAGLQRGRGAALRHARLARVHAGQAGWHEWRVLPRPPHPQHPEPLLLRRQQPVRGDDRQAPLVREHHLLPDAARRERRPLQGPQGARRARLLLPDAA